MRLLHSFKTRLVGSFGLVLCAGAIAIGCGSANKIGSGLSEFGQNTGSAIGHLLPGGGGANAGGLDANTAISLGGKFLDAVDMYNAQRQEELGQSVAAAITNQYTLDTDRKLADYVNLVGMTVASMSPRPELEYSFGVLNSDEVGAYSTPGGYIFITRGALKMTSDESELAGVLAHEVAHVALNHGIDAVKNSKWTDLAVSGAEVKSAELRELNQFTDGAVQVVLVKGYSRGQESQADAEAVKYLIAAGYDPNGLLRFLQKLQVKIGAGGGLDQLMKTHPGTAERVASVQQQIATLPQAGGVTLKERFAMNVK